MSERKFPMPEFMQPGSKGPVVNLLLKYLDPKATEHVPGPTGIVLDGEFGPTGTREMIAWQEKQGITADGGCGPETRKALKRAGFDLDEAAHGMPLDADITAFVQLSGTILYWVPHVLASRNLSEVQHGFRQSRRGN
jgi:hypothetical protein